MGRALFVVAALTGLAACGGQKVAQDPPSTPTSARASPSATPSLLPPVMPALAKEHTEAGARAFVEYYWKVVNFSSVTFATAPLEALNANGCEGCNRGLEAIHSDASAGAVVRGGAMTPTAIEVKWQIAGARRFVIASFDLVTEPQLVDYPSPSADHSYAGGTSRLKLRLDATPRGWTVTEWNPIG